MAGKTSWLLLAAVTLAGAAFFVVAGRIWSEGRELRDEGVTVKAVVLSKSGNESGDYRARVAFVDTDSPREVEITMNDRSWRDVKNGERIDVSYIPGRPETAEMGALLGHHILGWFAAFFAVVGGGMAAM